MITAMALSEEVDEDVKIHAVVIVLGDVGRSPRMQYQTVSLLEEGHRVSLVGYEGEDLIPPLSGVEERLNVIRFKIPSLKVLKSVLPLYFLWRVLSLCLYLLYALFVSVPSAGRNMKQVDLVLVQNPPALPLLAVSYFYCFLKKVQTGKKPALVIDWHNLGFTMLPNSFLSKIARSYERMMAPKADAHLCVTRAMKSFVETQFAIPANSIHVLYDCPPEMFRPLSTTDQHDLLARIHTQLCVGCPKSWYQNLDPTRHQTLFTEKNAEGECIPLANRPALVTSSTSWTPDEDFGQLIAALVDLDNLILRRQSSLKIMFVVTGKGPQKSHYQQEISKLKLQSIAIQTLWMEPADYPLLLACADLGVSLHTSTSGIDLPMKVLDLFGCGVPVCARNFQCLPELVEDGVNGRIFESSQELCEQLWSLLHKLPESGQCGPHSYGDLASYSRSLKGRTRWQENWKKHALPALVEVTSI